jgi:hypothetical protein
MIVENRIERPQTPGQARSRKLFSQRWTAAVRPLAIFAAFLAVVVVLQIAGGAYRAEFSGYPDEPAHYVTSLMVHDYLTSFDPVSPMQFAENYYQHYPKVAFGHWPPFFYLVQALWMLLFSASRTSIRLELACTSALLAYAVYAEARRWFGARAGFLAGLLTVCLPLVQIYSAEEMSETLLVLLCFESAVYLGRYLESERWQDNVWFGVFFSLAVLTKGSGWLLVLLPPVAMLLTKQLRLLKRPGFWLSAALVAALCLPWQLMTLQVAERGWAGGSQPSVGYTLEALKEFLVILMQITGPVLAVLVGIGIVVTVALPLWRRKAVAARPAAMLALLIAVWLFHALVPAGVEDRKMILAVPALILFLFGGGCWVAGRLPLRGNLTRWRTSAVAGLAALCFSLQTFAIPRQKHYGYDQAAQFLAAHPELRGTILVSSDSIGEGLLISELAMREARPGHVILRGTKLLAEVDWNVTRYQSLFASPAEVLAALDHQQVQVVVTDTFPAPAHFLHNRFLAEAIRNSGRFRLLATFPKGLSGVNGPVQVFQLTI